MVIFTASDQSYAESVLAHIDPNRTYFKYRFYRDSCVKTTSEKGTIYVKDLRIFKNISMTNMVIIDNSVLCFAFQLANGIPILPYYHNKDDVELTVLKNYLIKLAKFDDIQQQNKLTFNLHILLEEAKNEKQIEEVSKEPLKENKVEKETKKDDKPKTASLFDEPNGVSRRVSKVQTHIYESLQNAKKK